MKSKKVGSVLVVGAGIAGIQASLDLADSGFKVYLVEQGPSIGGVMSQLDKTFPTNDCSMCILSPKLVEASRHPNIEVLDYSEVEEVQGRAGDFRVRVRRKARSVDLAKCTGCGLCAASCPVRQEVRVPAAFEPEPDEITRETDLVIERCGEARTALIQVLQETQRRFRWLPEAALRRIASRLKVPFAEVYGTASFYKAFHLEPRGRTLIQVCMGTACHVRGARRVLEESERVLGLKAGQTTADLRFSLETVNCLGACALGPIVVAQDSIHGGVSPSAVAGLITGLGVGGGMEGDVPPRAMDGGLGGGGGK